jgi:N-acetylmuramoyl-L-alanine amidase
MLIGQSVVFLSCNLSALPLPAQAAKAPYIVVLDPGHGGHDSGTSIQTGKNRVSEKEIALAIAIRTAKILRDKEYTRPLGRPVEVILTREKDEDISLEKRSELARTKKAHLFLSIHLNSDPSKKARGFETYFLDNTDLTSSSKLEQIENRSSKKFAGADKQASLLVRSIAADAMVETSRDAAKTVHDSVITELKSQDVKVHDRGVRQGMFYVLLDAQVPSVLLESFFLTHPKDRAFISEPENREKVAQGVAKGVLRFLALQ